MRRREVEHQLLWQGVDHRAAEGVLLLVLAAARAKKEKSKAVAKKKPIGLLSRRERQVNELKTLARIGRQDPERLAAIITRMLLDEGEGRERERLKYERMIWRKAEQHGQPPPEEEGKQKKDDDKGPVE